MRSNRTAWALLAPTLLVLGFAGLMPFFYVIWVGFHDWNLDSKVRGMVWSFASNYRKVVFDTDFLFSLGRGILFTLATVSISMCLGLLFATLLSKPFKGRSIFRTIHALPLTIAPIAVGATWRIMINPGLGIGWYILQKIGIDFNIGTNAGHAFLATVLMDVWHWVPFITLTFLAGLTALPTEPFESAMVDGANRWQILIHITIPLLRPVLLTAMFLRIMDALRIVDEVWMLTQGGPGMATRYLGIFIWRVVNRRLDYGYGSAVSVLVLYITIVLCWVLIASITRSEEGTEQ
jgi:multiple sugar transport system permease protein